MPRKPDAAPQSIPPQDDALYVRFRAELEEAWYLSGLRVWMTADHAELAGMMRRSSMDWADAAVSFKLAGLRDHRARFPWAETAAETWRRVDAR